MRAILAFHRLSRTNIFASSRRTRRVGRADGRAGKQRYDTSLVTLDKWRPPPRTESTPYFQRPCANKDVATIKKRKTSLGNRARTLQVVAARRGKQQNQHVDRVLHLHLGRFTQHVVEDGNMKKDLCDHFVPTFGIPHTRYMLRIFLGGVSREGEGGGAGGGGGGGGGGGRYAKAGTCETCHPDHAEHFKDIRADVKAITEQRPVAMHGDLRSLRVGLVSWPGRA